MATTVRDLMKTKLATLTAGEPVDLAEGMMKRVRVRHLPVLRDGKLEGLVTHRDLLRAQARLLTKAMRITDKETHAINVLVDEIMTRDVHTISPDLGAVDAARMMLVNKTGCLIVVENERVVGIITEADFVEWAMKEMAKS